MIRPVSPAFPARPAAAPDARPEPAHVSPARLPDAPHLGWAMVNLGLLTLLGGALSRLF